MQNFWNTISKYPVFLLGIVLGVFLNAFKSLEPFLKNPISAIALTGLFLGGIVFIGLTLRAMLGLSPV